MAGPAPEPAAAYEDPALRADLHRIQRSLPPGIAGDALIAALRGGTEAIEQLSDSDLARGGAFVVETIPLPEGPELLVCTPSVAVPAGILYHVHGGGMIAGDSRNGVAEMLDWAAELALVVVSVDYRLAPETPYPGGLDDCAAGLDWTYRHAADRGLGPRDVLVVGGSAGGALAAGSVLRARDLGTPLPGGLMLLGPMLDDRGDSASARQLEGHGVWDRAANATGWEALLGPRHPDNPVPPYAAPGRAARLDGLPPVYLDVGTAETFRDETVAWAAAIWAQGGNAELHVWPGGFHGFASMAPDAPLSRAAAAARLDWVRRLFVAG